MKLKFNPFKKINIANQRETQHICPLCHVSHRIQSQDEVWQRRYRSILGYANVVHDDATCLACSTQQVNAVINEHIDTHQVHVRQPAQAANYVQQHGMTPLLEGVDYHINAQGNWVFSRWNLLKRAKCCGSGCQNCPYGHVNVKKR